MASTTNTNQPTKRVASVTGYSIPVGKWRKLSGEPCDGARATDCMLIPAGAIGRFPPTSWGEWGSVRTYRFWQGSREVSTPNMEQSTRELQPRSNQGSLSLTRRSGEYDCGTRDPCGRRHTLSRMRDLSQSDTKNADGIRDSREDGRREGGQRQARPPQQLHPELLEISSEGGSDPTSSGGSSDSEEVEECSVHGSTHDLCDAECRTRDGFLVYDRTSGRSSEGGRTDEESDDVEEQEGEDQQSSPPSE